MTGDGREAPYIQMKRIVKQGLLKWGGYDLARRVYKHVERRTLQRRIRAFTDTGHMALPERVIFEPTQRCNLRCRMCWQDRAELAAGQEMPLSEILAFFDAVPYLKKVTLIGGEVFIRGDILELLLFLNRSRDLVISTNGTRIGERTLSVLRRLNRIFTICISLDGNRPLHDAIRGVPGSFDKAAESVRRLAPWFPVTVNCVILDQNLEALPGLVRLCASLGARKVKLELERRYTADKIERVRQTTGSTADRLPSASGRGPRGYPLQLLARVLDDCRRQAARHGLHLATDPPFLSQALEDCYHDRLRETHVCVCRHFQTATITPEGELVHCEVIREPFGSIRHHRLGQVWNCDAATTFRRRLIDANMTAVCENCPHLVPVARR